MCLYVYDIYIHKYQLLRIFVKGLCTDTTHAVSIDCMCVYVK